MSKCQETAGILFEVDCSQSATLRCTRCRKRVCETHARTLDDQRCCISCIRNALRTQKTKPSVDSSDLTGELFFHWYLESHTGTSFSPEEFEAFSPAATADHLAHSTNHARSQRNHEDEWAGT